jgi:hypothetical protein
MRLQFEKAKAATARRAGIKTGGRTGTIPEE